MLSHFFGGGDIDQRHDLRDGTLMFVRRVERVYFLARRVDLPSRLAARHPALAFRGARPPVANFYERVIVEDEDGNRLGRIGQVAYHQLRPRFLIDAAQPELIRVQCAQFRERRRVAAPLAAPVFDYRRHMHGPLNRLDLCRHRLRYGDFSVDTSHFLTHVRVLDGGHPVRVTHAAGPDRFGIEFWKCHECFFLFPFSFFLYSSCMDRKQWLTTVYREANIFLERHAPGGTLTETEMDDLEPELHEQLKEVIGGVDH